MILAAGFGKRMLPLTEKIPKALAKVQGEPLIVHQINRLVQAGMGPIIINLGHLGDQIERYLGNGRSFGTDILYSQEGSPLGTAGGIIKALPLLGTDPFVVVSADIYTDFPYKTLPMQPQGLAHLVVTDNPVWHPKGDFGLTEDYRLTNQGKVTYTFANIGVYSPELFETAPQGLSSLFPWLREVIENGQVTGEQHKGLWHNVGTIEELEILSVSSKMLTI
jgi:MurNAc alpha-1-phosphate uridylyltransferase